MILLLGFFVFLLWLKSEEPYVGAVSVAIFLLAGVEYFAAMGAFE